jgi:rubrerythrin
MPATSPAELSSDPSRVRAALVRALEAVTHYEASAAAAESDEVRAFFTHLASEEKEHVAEAIAVLRTLDPVQDQVFGKEFTQAYFEKPIEIPLPAEKTLERLAAQPEHVLHAIPAAPGPAAGKLTVGSLRNR